jgi:hypothetical protein
MKYFNLNKYLIAWLKTLYKIWDIKLSLEIKFKFETNFVDCFLKTDCFHFFMIDLKSKPIWSKEQSVLNKDEFTIVIWQLKRLSQLILSNGYVFVYLYLVFTNNHCFLTAFFYGKRKTTLNYFFDLIILHYNL